MRKFFQNFIMKNPVHNTALQIKLFILSRAFRNNSTCLRVKERKTKKTKLNILYCPIKLPFFATKNIITTIKLNKGMSETNDHGFNYVSRGHFIPWISGVFPSLSTSPLKFDLPQESRKKYKSKQ